MIRFAPFFLLLSLSCLPSRPATAQAIKPLAPIVVQLRAGDVVAGPLIGLDSATYQAARHALALVPLGDAVQADLRHQAALTSQQLASALAELRRCQAGRAASEADYERMRTAARAALAQPPRPPRLLDSHFYQGTLVGAVVLGLFKLLVLH